MTRQKNKILTFLFSLIPGAGQMYLGFMKRGLSLIFYVVAIGCVAMVLTIEELLILIPPVWMYAFFDALNLNGADPEFFKTVEDNYITFVSLDILPGFKAPSFSLETKKLWGKGMIAAGMIFLSYNILTILGEFAYNLNMPAFGWFINDILRYAPRFIFAVILITSGKALITGNKRFSDTMDFTIYVNDFSDEGKNSSEIIPEMDVPEYTVEEETEPAKETEAEDE